MAVGDPVLDPFGVPESPWGWMPSSWGAPDVPTIPPEAPPVIAPDPALAAPVEASPVPVPVEATLAGPPIPFAQDIPPPVPVEPIPAAPAIAPQPDLVPDAISTAEGQAPTGELAGVPYAPTRTPEQLPGAAYRSAVTGLPEGSPWDESGGSLLSPEHQRRYLGELSTRDPAKFAAVSLQLDDIKERQALAEQQRIANESWERQQQIARDREEAMKIARQKSEALEAEAQRIADMKIDPTGGLSGGQKVFGVLGAIIGGLVQGRTGSARNAGMDALDGIINRGIDAQKAEIANKSAGLATKRNLLADQLARTNSEFEAQETLRLAALKYAYDKLAVERQNYARGGTTDLKIANMQAQILAAQAKSRADSEQKLYDDSLKEREQRRKEAETEAQIANQRAQIGLGYAQLKNAAADRKAAADARAADKAAERADKEAERSRQFTLSAPRAVLLLGDDGKPVAGPDGKPVTTGTKLINADGKEWQLGDPEERRAMKAKLVTTAEITDMIHEVKDIRSKVGGELMPWSAAKQRLDVIGARLGLMRKSGMQGVSSDKDFEYLERSVGAGNLSSFIDQTAKLDAALEGTVRELNTEMRTANYTGPAISFENKYTSAKNTPEDDRRKGLLKDRGVSLDQAIKQNIDKAVGERGYGLDLTDPADQALYRRVRDETQASFTPGVAGDQAQDIAALGRSAATGDVDALTVLNEIATKAQTSKLRDLAKAQIEALKPAPPSRGPRSIQVDVPDELRLP